LDILLTMKLILCKPRGFCAGVERAIDTVKRALELWGAPIYVKHEIVHNRHVIEDLKRRGAIFVEEVAEVPEGARVIYSAHGVSPAVRQEAKARGLIEIDASCGLVTKVHSAAKRFAEKGYHILLIGHRKHVEIIGTQGEAPEVTTVVESVDEVEKLPFSPGAKLAYLTQTTLSLDDVKEISDALIRRFPQIETLPSSSICYATTNRQMALREIAEKVELVLVIGDLKSSNSNRLREVAERRGILAFLINGPEEIQSEWLKGVSAIGMTAGASTPEEIVQACVERLYEFGVSSTEEAVFVEENVFFQLPKQVLEMSRG
jgi:4-hydroxy-3-methylbut-2-enyl diphosphate reductase